MLLNVFDYHMRLEEALDAAADGDRIYLPRGTYHAPANGWKVTKAVEIFGDGPGQANDWSGTTLNGNDANSDVLVIAPPVNTTLGSISIHDIKIKQPSPLGQRFGKSGISCVMSDPGQAIESLRLARVVVQNLTGNAFSLDPGSGVIRSLSIALCGAIGCAGYGFSIKNVLLARVALCASGGNDMGGLKIDSSGAAVHLYLSGGDAVSASATQGQVLFSSCPVAHMEGADCEGFGLATKKLACEFRACCGAAAFVANFCNASDSGVSETALLISAAGVNAPAGPTTVLGNWFGVEDHLISVDASAKGVVVLGQGQTYGVTGTIELPGDLSQTNGGLWGAPYIRRTATPSDAVTGFIIPSRAGFPISPLQNGMLVYDSVDGALAARINGIWKYISTS